MLILLCVNRVIQNFKEKKDQLDLVNLLIFLREFLKRIQFLQSDSNAQNAIRLVQQMLREVTRLFSQDHIWEAYHQGDYSYGNNEHEEAVFIYFKSVFERQEPASLGRFSQDRLNVSNVSQISKLSPRKK